MKILLMGGTGAMGTPLAQILADMGYSVEITSRSEHAQTEAVHYIKADGHDLDFMRTLLAQNHYDAIVDFLKYTPEQFESRIDILLNGTEQYFLLSSCRVYADSGNEAITEEHARLLDSNVNEAEFITEMYALTKAREENILIGTQRKNWTIIRPYLTYNDYRMQLGFYEKDQWLYRVLLGRTLLFPSVLADRRTTLTHGFDVATLIAALIGRKEAKGAVFNLASSENHTWREILQLYSDSLFRNTGKCLNIRYIKDITQFYKFWPFSLINYDRCYNRVFNNKKLLSVIGDYRFIPLQEGLELCIKNFLQNPLWQGYLSQYEAWSDRLLKEFTPIMKIPGKRPKIRYLIDRFL